MSLRIFFCFFCVAVGALLIAGLISARHVEPDASLQEASHPTGRSVVQQVGYVRDGRTGVCFAYRFGRPSHDGPSLALATVPCELIPAALLELVP